MVQEATGADRLRRGRRRPDADGLRLPARRAGRGGGRARPRRSARPAARRSTGAPPSRRSAASTSGSSSTTRTSTWRCGWRPRGARCRLAPEARALHAYSPSLGAASAAKYARTGWSRGYMLRRYGVMRDPRLALRVLASEGAIGAGQLLRDHTAAGIAGRVRGFRAGAGLERREVGRRPAPRPQRPRSDRAAPPAPAPDAHSRPSQPPGAARSPPAARRRRSRRLRGRRARPSSLPRSVAPRRRSRGGAGEGAGLDRGDPGERGERA